MWTGRPLALDLGTVRTRLARPGDGILVDEPTVLARDTDGASVAVGWVALRLAAERPGIRLVYPVRQGRVVDAVSCVHFLRRLLRTPAGRSVGVPEVVAVAVPTHASAHDIAVLTGVVGAVLGGRVLTVNALEAAARLGDGAHDSDDERAHARPHLLCDLGAGVCEVAAVDADGSVLASSALPLVDNGRTRDATGAVDAAVLCVADVAAKVPDDVAASLYGSPLRLVGGTALVPGIEDAIGAHTGMEVQRRHRPRDAVVTGLCHRLSGLDPAPAGDRQRTA